MTAQPNAWTSTFAGAVAIVAITVLFRVTELDIALQSLAYDPRTSGWPYAEQFPWKWLHDYGTIPGLLFALGAIGLVAAGFLHPRYGVWRFPALYVVALTAVGPGVVTNLFGKILAGRPRPEEVVEFGGTLRFLEPFELGTPGRGFSFLCGHCSMGYLFVALFFLLKSRMRWLALAASLAFGLLLGVARVADGAHFPSDVTLAGAITFTLAAAMSPLARLHVPVDGWQRRGRLAVSAIVAAVALLIFFSFSTPINRERVHTWTDHQRRAATHETILPWRGAERLFIDVGRGDVRIRTAPRADADAVTVVSVVKGFGFPGSDGRVETEREHDRIVYRHRLTGFLWEAHVRFDVTIAPHVRPEAVHVTTGDGQVVRMDQQTSPR